MERLGSRVQYVVIIRKKFFHRVILWGDLFSFDNYQVCFDQIHQKDAFLYIPAPFAPLETRTSATQFYIECRTQAELQHMFVSIGFSFPSVNFGATCKEYKFLIQTSRSQEHGSSLFL